MANKSILDQLDAMVTIDEVSLLGDSAMESEIFMEALREECTPEEYNAIMEDSAVEMALYGLIDDADVAMEANRTIVKMSKQGSFNRIEKRAAIRLAQKAQDSLYEKYAKYRKLFIEFRDKIYQKYGTKAKTEAKKILQNSRRKATSMPSAAGKSIVDKMDVSIKKASGK